MNKINIIFILALMLVISIGCKRLMSENTANTKSETNTNTNTAKVETDYEKEQKKKSKRDSWVNDKIKELTKLPKKTQLTKEPYINGLAVAYRLGEFAEGEYVLDDDFIPTGKMAYEESEVGTIILLKEKSEWIGDYALKGKKPVPGFVLYKEVIIIDRSIPAVIYRKTFKGEPPPKTAMVSDNDLVVDGESPDAKVKEFLNGLPSKNS